MAMQSFSFGHPCEHQLKRSCIGGSSCPLNGYPDNWCCSFVKGKINFKRDKPCEGTRCRWGFNHPSQSQFDAVTQVLNEGRLIAAKIDEAEDSRLLVFNIENAHVVDTVQCALHMMLHLPSSCAQRVGQLFAWAAVKVGDAKVFMQFLKTMKKPVDAYILGAYTFLTRGSLPMPTIRPPSTPQQTSGKGKNKGKNSNSASPAASSNGSGKEKREEVLEKLKNAIVDLMNAALSQNGQLVDREDQHILQAVFIQALRCYPKNNRKRQEMLELAVNKFGNRQLPKEPPAPPAKPEGSSGGVASGRGSSGRGEGSSDGDTSPMQEKSTAPLPPPPPPPPTEESPYTYAPLGLRAEGGGVGALRLPPAATAPAPPPLSMSATPLTIGGAGGGGSSSTRLGPGAPGPRRPPPLGQPALGGSPPQEKSGAPSRSSVDTPASATCLSSAGHTGDRERGRERDKDKDKERDRESEKGGVALHPSMTPLVLAAPGQPTPVSTPPMEPTAGTAPPMGTATTTTTTTTLPAAERGSGGGGISRIVRLAAPPVASQRLRYDPIRTDRPLPEILLFGGLFGLSPATAAAAPLGLASCCRKGMPGSGMAAAAAAEDCPTAAGTTMEHLLGGTPAGTTMPMTTVQQLPRVATGPAAGTGAATGSSCLFSFSDSIFGNLSVEPMFDNLDTAQLLKDFDDG